MTHDVVARCPPSCLWSMTVTQEWRSVPGSGIFHAMRNKGIPGTIIADEPPLKSELLTILREALKACLPAAWDVNISIPKEFSPDAILTIIAPDGSAARVAVEMKRHVDPKDVPQLLDQHSHHEAVDRLLVAAPFLGPRTRERLRTAGVNYVDATGNLRLELNKPVAVIALDGASVNPWNEPRPLHSLKGPTAGRVVRALCDFQPPFGIRELAERSHTSVATVSRVVALLDREALVTRVGRGTVAEVAWTSLIRRWIQDYALTTSNTIRNFLEPRGLDALLRKLAAADLRHAVTSSLAAARVAPITPSRLAVIYVDDIEAAATSLKLRRTESGANVLLAGPYDAVVYDRASRQDGITYAALTQVVADLLTSPGRGPAEGEELLRWMERHEHVWRH